MTDPIFSLNASRSFAVCVGLACVLLFSQEVSIILPDEAELDRAAEDEGGVEVSKGVTLRTLRSSG